MDRKSFELLYKDAADALSLHHLLEAHNCIRGILFNIENQELNREMESISQDYRMMLAFMEQGGTDAQRSIIHRNLTNRSYALLDKAARLYHTNNEKDIYAETCKRLHAETQPEPIGKWLNTADLLREKLEEERRQNGRPSLSAEEISAFYTAYDTLFEYIWTSPLIRPDEAELWRNFIERQDAGEQAMLVSAIMLNIQRYFDPQKFRILLHLCRSEKTQVRVRALTAAVFAYMQYEKRFTDYPDLAEGLSLLAQDTALKEELILLQRQALLSLETTKAEKKLQNEIFPDLIRNKNYQRNKMGFDQMEEDLAKALRGEPNAEWEQMQGNKQLADNMKKIIAMGKEGIDINLGTFSSLKGFSFFQSVAHWFAPFSELRPEIQNIFSGQAQYNPIKTLMEAGNFCDSDKYSLCMMLNQIAPSQREMITTQLGSQIDGNTEGLKEIANDNRTIGSTYRNYLQDLYRFFKLYPHKAQFNDPFKSDLLFTRYEVLNSMLKTPDYLRDMASFLIKRECYQDAITYIEEALKYEKADAEILQKVAFCYQHIGQPNKAIYYYQQADVLNPDNEWLLKQMNLCYSALGRCEQQLSCLKKLEKMNPDDARLISETGLCLMQMGQYEEAARRFYELEYKGERVIPSWRAIAWCCFKMGRLEQADKYYKKILQQDKVTWEDHLNAGHTAWCRGLISEAVIHYRNFIKLYGNKRKDNTQPLLQPFDDDRDELLCHGIENLDISLMRDLLQSLENPV